MAQIFRSGSGKAIAWYEIVGGAATLVLLFMQKGQMIPPSAGSPQAGVSFALQGPVLFLAFCAVISLIAGILLLRGRANGRWLSCFVQLLQLPVLYLAGLQYNLFLLFSVGPGVDSGNDILLRYFAGSGFEFCLSDCRERFIGINIIAFFVLVMLVRLQGVDKAEEVQPVLKKSHDAVVESGSGVSGLGRRSIAFVIDVMLMVCAALFLYSLVGLAVPMDNGVMAMILVPFLLAGFVYVAGAPLLLTNSFGKYLLRIRVADEVGGGKPSAKQCLFRGLLLMLWPLEGLVVLVSKNKKRIGDRLAGTLVVLEEGRRPGRIVRVVLAVVVLGVAFGVAMGGMGMAARNTGLFKVAAGFVKQNVVDREVYGSPTGIGFLPQSVIMVKNSGRVVLSLTGLEQPRFALVVLERQPEGWQVRDWRLISEEVSRSYSYSY